MKNFLENLACHEKFGPPPRKWTPQSRYFEIFGPPVQMFRNIWTPMELIFQKLDEIFGLPMKFLGPPLQTVNKLLKKQKIVKSQYYYVN